VSFLCLLIKDEKLVTVIPAESSVFSSWKNIDGTFSAVLYAATVAKDWKVDVDTVQVKFKKGNDVSGSF